MNKFEAISKVTERYQTTVPAPVRQLLSLGSQDHIRYSVNASGELVISRVEMAEDPDANLDPSVGAFLQFLEAEITRNPGRLQPIDMSVFNVLGPELRDIELDLDSLLDPADD